MPITRTLHRPGSRGERMVAQNPSPYTHHQILSVVEPFTRRGRQVDLAASDRMARRLAFKPVDHAELGATEVLQLENPGAERWRLSRLLTLVGGAQAQLVAEGKDPADLLARVEAVDPSCHISSGPGWVLAKSHKLELRSAPPRPGDLPPLILTDAVAQFDGLRLKLRVSPVKGIAGEVELQATGGDDTLTLPEDLLAVLGWDWARLIETGGGWRTRLRLRGGGAARSQDAEAKLDRAVRHLAQTLAEPPALFHDKQVGARWRVVLHRAMPLLGGVALVVGAALVAKLDLAQDSLVRMLIFHSPPILLMLFFCMNELPRVEIPPLPRRPSGLSWRVPRVQAAR